VSARRYARSPLDGHVHLLTDDPHSGVPKARCAVEIPADVHQFDQPPLGSPCEECRLSLIAEMAASTP
jgi:hypothetical protein